MFEVLPMMMAHLCSWHLTGLTNEARIQPEEIGSFLKQPGRPSASASWIKPIPLSYHNLPPLWRNTQRSCVRITVSSSLASAPLAWSHYLTYLHIAPIKLLLGSPSLCGCYLGAARWLRTGCRCAARFDKCLPFLTVSFLVSITSLV